MGLKNNLLYIILLCVFVKLLWSRKIEAFTMDRIDVNGITFEDNGVDIVERKDNITAIDGDYIYCMNGEIKCDGTNNILEQINNTSYTLGKTYKNVCPDGTTPKCEGNYFDDISKNSIYLVEYNGGKLENPVTVMKNFDSDYSTFTMPYSYIPIKVDNSNKTVKYYDQSNNEYQTNTCVLEGKSIYDCFIYDDVKVNTTISLDVNDQQNENIKLKYNVENDKDEYIKQYDVYDIETKPTDDYKNIYKIDLKTSKQPPAVKLQ